MPRMTTAEAVIETVLTHGIDTIFALPGVHNDHLFDAARRASDRIRIIHPRHELIAAYMALGATLVTGRRQAFAVVPGPGILSASAALLMAHAMGAPVIALAGQIPSFAIDQGARASARNPRPDRAAAPYRQTCRTNTVPRRPQLAAPRPPRLRPRALPGRWP
jgi:thiamine pyrophosphate-dependent acetolactate synthase large subunit-like protein